MKKLLLTAAAVILLIAACEPTVGVDLNYDYPYCPTTDSLFVAADSVPLGCPVPASP